MTALQESLAQASREFVLTSPLNRQVWIDGKGVCLAPIVGFAGILEPLLDPLKGIDANEHTAARQALPVNSSTTIHFVRHGSVHNPQEILYGRLPRFGLSAEGTREVEALIPYFQNNPVEAVYSSPLLRARQTAARIALACGVLKVSVSALLIEGRTPYDGKPLHWLDARNWDLYSGNPPPNEQPVDVFRRAHRFVRRILRSHPGKQVAAVTHADLILFLALWANGYEVNPANRSLVEQRRIPITFPATASVTSLTWQPGADLPRFSYHHPGSAA